MYPLVRVALMWRLTECVAPLHGCTNEFLLGVDFMKPRGAVMDFHKSEVRYREAERAVVISFRTYYEAGGTRIAAVRMTPIEVVVPATDGEQGIFLLTKKIGSIMLAVTVTMARSGRAWVPALNTNSAPASLPNKKELGTWIPLEEDMAMKGGLDARRVQNWLDDLGDGKTPLDNEDEVQIGAEEAKDRKLMLQLLRRRRQAQTEDEIVAMNVTKMLQACVIEEGNGAWGFPVVLVRKKGGEIRFCENYRASNKVTKKDVYPLPCIDGALEAMRGSLLFTTLAGYWQIMVAPEDRDKTAFLTKKGLYRFVHMPFGFTNAPSTFQRMMNHVLRGLTWSTCLVYLDDIVVFNMDGMELYVVELASVLERLEATGLTLKLRKCRFAMQSMEYLGHELSKDGVRPVQRLVTVVLQFPRPSDAVEAKGFVHLAGYYRRFVAGFGSMMAPITKL
ncbi:unnamed protein product [Phytophthora fragariaefolia]|uniref:Unnamed protein product n=1 Tax=Phytophthora fragariaefolia TaxID=1490495 RepID=A0A9W7D4P8_9STRA|nr:unnamed protein product [Phytophthora fragariaefolia]